MSAEASQHSSMAEALSSFLPLLAATPEPDLPSLLPSLAKLRSVLLLSLKEAEGDADDSGLGLQEEPARLEGDGQGCRLVVSLQSGPAYELTEPGLAAAFAQFGQVVACCLGTSSNRVGTSGSVTFRDLAAAKAATYTLVRVAGCTVHAFPPWETLGEEPVPHQVLVAGAFPNVWERDLLARRFFNQYGRVTALDWLPEGGLLRAVVSFEKAGVARALWGSRQKVFGSQPFVVREVSGLTLLDWRGRGPTQPI